MKKMSILAASLVWSVILTGCSSTTSPGNIPDILADNPDPQLTAISFIENEATGVPQSYEELQDFIKPYSSVNYLEYEIIKRYSSEEAFEITNDDMFLYGATLYDIHVIYDCINDRELDIYTKLSSAGTVEEQFKGYPPYIEGDRFACFLPQFDPDTVNYEFSELMFAIDNGAKTPVGYHIGFDNIDFVNQSGNSIADETFAVSSVITSTSNNPVTYTDMITLDTLSNFLRQDWLERGYELSDNLTKEESNETLQ